MTFAKIALVFLVSILGTVDSIPAADQIVLSDILGQTEVGKLSAQEVTFVLRATVDDQIVQAIENGFVVYSTDGATWGATEVDTLVPLKGTFTLAADISYYSADGEGADTVGIWGIAWLGTGGFPAGYDEDILEITIQLSSDDVGKTICLDSAAFGSWEWKWSHQSGPVIYPDWGGPYCFEVVEGTVDSDSDGILDGDDNCRWQYNPLQVNSDTDDLGDVCDNCLHEDNPDQGDRDTDGVGDVCDNCPNTSNPNQVDSDVDEIGDNCDNCTAVANINQVDTDGDQLGDACDPVTVAFTADPRLGDSPLTVTFTDQSFGLNPIDDWLWDFGDLATSTDQHPTHEYTADGYYDVQLVVSDGADSDTLLQTAYVLASDYPYEVRDTDVPTTAMNHIRTCDLDRDNLLDVVWTGFLADQWSVAYGEEGGTLGSVTQYDGSGTAGIVAFGFMNSDSLIDVVLRDFTTLEVWLNDGNRGFVLNESISQSFPQRMTAVVLGYFDNDAYLDVITDAGSFRGDGDGHLTAGLSAPQFHTADVGDFNGDGVDDLIIGLDTELAVYTNDGAGSFTKAGSVIIAARTWAVSTANGLADFNHDGHVDFASVSERTETTGDSEAIVVFGDGSGGIDHTSVIPLDGITYNVVVIDANRDRELDLVLSVSGRLEFHHGVGDGTFVDPGYVEWDIPGAPVSSPLALADGDLDRDGNPDLFTGSLAGSAFIRVAVSYLPDAPILPDEMRTIGYDDIQVSTTNPGGFIVSRNYRTVAGSNYYRFDSDADGTVDHQTIDYNLQEGRYTIEGSRPPNTSPDEPWNMGIGINGSQAATIALNYTLPHGPDLAPADADEEFVFRYTIESPPSIYPENGIPYTRCQPLFDWSGLASDDPTGTVYALQLDRYHDFRIPPVDYEISGLTEPRHQLPLAPGLDTVLYWRVLTSTDNGLTYPEVSDAYAVYIVKCCDGRVGDANSSGEGEPTIGDISLMIDALFIRGDIGMIYCLTEADINQSGGACPSAGDITIGDISTLVDYLFITGPATYGPLPGCL